MTYYVNRRWTTAKKTVNNNGRMNDSKFEAGYANELILRKKAGDIKDFEEQVTLDLEVNGYRVCTYRIDFIVYHNDGMTEYVECKGYPTDVWKLKWKLFEALFTDKPDTRLTIEMQGKYKPPKLRKLIK